MASSPAMRACLWLRCSRQQPIGEKMRGANMASYILAVAKDGYRVVFALAEMDPTFNDSKVLVAYAANGKPLPAGQVPFRIVAPQEKRAARSIRMLHESRS